MSVESIIDTLSQLPLGVLYLIIGAISAIENVFPPFPADAVVALGSFLAARGRGSPYSAFVCAWVGNLIGAAFTYYLGRRYGSGPFLVRLERWVGKDAEARFMKLYEKYGLPALFVSRFLPAVRSLVPPLAGAMKLPPAAGGSRSRQCFGHLVRVPHLDRIPRRLGLGRSLRIHREIQQGCGKRRTGSGRARHCSSLYPLSETKAVSGALSGISDELSRAFYLERFHDFLAVEKGASPRTDEAYLRDLARFATFAHLKGRGRAEQRRAANSSRVRVSSQGSGARAGIDSAKRVRRAKLFPIHARRGSSGS